MFKHGFPPEWSTFKKLIWLVGTGIAGAASGIWKTVTGTLIHITDALASPVKELSIAIEPLQSGSGDPSPTNIRPITGWTGANINVSGADTSSPTTYPISWQTEAGTVYGGTLTINEDGSVDLASNSVYFDPYNYLNKFKQGNGNVYMSGTDFIPLGMKFPINKDRCKCNILKALSASSASTPSFSIGVGGTFAVNGAAGITDTVANWTTYVTDNHATNPIYFILELATPVTYHLDSTEALYTLAGENNIWADVNGEITLTYLAQAE